MIRKLDHNYLLAKVLTVNYLMLAKVLTVNSLICHS